MSQHRPSRLLALVAALGLTGPAVAQKPQPIQPNPHAPQLAMPAPLGIQRGTSLDLTLTGGNLAEPTGLWTSIPGAKVTIPTENNNGKDNAKLLVRLEVPQDAPLGYHGLRLATTRGVSNLRLFCVDELPQVTELDNNRSLATAQPVPVPAVVVGRADAEVSDFFKVTVKAGQRLSFEVLGHRLGSGFDPQLTLHDGRTKRELPGGHSNDAPGLQTDARLTYTFKEAGDYVVEVRDVMYRGGADFFYRLRIGDFPCATTPVPMAAKRGSKVTVQFAGPAVDGVAPVEVQVPSDPQARVVWVTPRGPNGLPGWPVALAVSDLTEAVEQEPNNEPAKAHPVPVPGAVTGRFQDKGDVDHFAVPAKKGERLLIEAQTQELYSPTEVYLVLKNEKGVEVARSNPAAAPQINFTAPEDGTYVLAVEHLLYWGGPTETYRITVEPYEPDFSLALGIDRYDVPPGGGAAVLVTPTRRDYAGPIEVNVVGHPGLTGQVTLAPGQANAYLYLAARPDVPPGPYSVTVQGTATINGKAVTRTADLRTVLVPTLGGLLYPPLQLNELVSVAVIQPPPFTLTAKLDLAEGLRGAAVPVTVTATRVPGFTEEIVVAALGLPANVTAALKNVPKGQNEVKGQLNPAANAALGAFPILLTGRAKFQNKDYVVTAAPLSLVVGLPFDLKVEPLPLKLAAGEKARLKVTAVRKGGYQGPIGVEVKNLPANVTAAKATIAMGQDAVEVELTAAANAAPGDKADVNVQGTATAAANQQNASPNFTVSVVKK